MNRFFVVAVPVCALLIACQPQGGGPSAQSLPDEYLGRWYFTGSSGGIDGDGTGEPATGWIVIKADNEIERYAADGSLATKESFQVGRIRSIYTGEDAWGLVGTGGLDRVIEVYGDGTLAISDNAYDGYSFGYRRSAQEAARVVPTEDPLVIDHRDAAWGPPGTTPRFPMGVQTAQLGIDPENGGPTYLARFPAGSHFDLHWHTNAEHVVVLQGPLTIVLGDETHALSSGSYVVIPEGMPHSWDVPGGGEAAVILVRRRGPADFNFVDP